MPYRKKLTILLLLLSPVASVAQSHRAWAEAARKAEDAGRCDAAVMYWQQAAAAKPSKPTYAYHLGLAALDCHAFAEAEKALRRCTAEIPAANYALGLALKRQAKYREAIEALQAYLQSSDHQFAPRARRELANCRYALGQKGDTSWTVRHLDKRINSPYSETAPVVAGDTLYYTSMRFRDRAGRRLSKIVYSVHGRKGRPLRYGFNRKDRMTAHYCPLPDGSGVFFNECQYDTHGKLRCDLFFRMRKKRRGWHTPKRLNINSPAYTTTHPHLFVDSLRHRMYLLFASDRPRGRGGTDIWMAPLDKDYQPGTPVNITSVNTEGDELSPFVDAATGTLYFSSDGQQNNLGGFDIYAATFDSLPVTAAPAPLPRPVNSEANDYFFVTATGNPHGYLVSDRSTALQIDKSLSRCCTDLFAWTHTPEPNPPAQTPPVDTPVIYSIHITTAPARADNPIPTTGATVMDSLEDLLPIRLFFDNDEPDKRTMATTTDKAYLDTYRDYVRREQEFIRHYTAGMSDVKARQATGKISDFFDYDVRNGGELLDQFTELLWRALRNDKQVEIQVRGYTSPRAQSAYNQALAKRRIASVVNHFARYRNGVLKSYLQTGRLRITELPLGETTAPAEVSDDLADRRRSIYSVEASLERRVEIVRIKWQ